MTDGSLNNDEIDRFLEGGDPPAPTTTPAPPEAPPPPAGARADAVRDDTAAGDALPGLPTPPDASIPAGDEPGQSPTQRRARLAALWRLVRPDLRVVLERDRVTVGDLLDPGMGATRAVPLRGRPVSLVAGGVPVAQGRIVRRRGRLALEIQSVGSAGSGGTE